MQQLTIQSGTKRAEQKKRERKKERNVKEGLIRFVLTDAHNQNLATVSSSSSSCTNYCLHTPKTAKMTNTKQRSCLCVCVVKQDLQLLWCWCWWWCLRCSSSLQVHRMTRDIKSESNKNDVHALHTHTKWTHNQPNSNWWHEREKEKEKDFVEVITCDLCIV